MDMSRGELKFVLYCFILIGGFVSIPYLWGYLSEPEDMAFSGMILGVNIIFGSYDWINQAREGSILLTTNRTHENVPPLFLNTLFLVMGLFARLTGLSTEATYRIFYIIFSLLFFLVLYRFIAYFLEDVRKRRVAFIIALTSSGFGFLFWAAFKALNHTPMFFSENMPLGSRIFPIDLWLTDVFPFLILYSYYIHHVAGLTVMLLIFMYFHRGWEAENIRDVVLYAGGLTFLLGTFHLYDVVIVYAVLAVYAALSLGKWDPKRVKLFAGYVAVSIPPMLFNFYAFALHPVFREFTNYNIQLSPNPYSFVIGLGIPFLLTVYYLSKGNLDKKKMFLAAWIIAALALAYAPITVQRKLQLGLSIPFAVIATYAIFEHILPRMGKSRHNLMLTVLILGMIPTNVLWIAKETYKVGLHGYPGTEYPYYTHNLDLEAIQWLGENAGIGDVILSGGMTGGRIAGMVSKKVYWGGNDMTLRYQEKKKLTEEFFSTMKESERPMFLRSNGITLIYYGEEERSLGDFNPEGRDYLRKVFDNGRVKIFRVKAK